MKLKKQVTAFLLAVTMLILQMPAFAASSKTADQEMRGVWIATVMNINFPSTPGISVAQQKAELDAIVENADYMGLNAIFFQVRPTGDALYNSKLFPWSAWLTGTQGAANAENFDPLAYIIEKAHSKHIELHAWINPLRISNTQSNPTQDINALSADNPARQHPEYAVAASDGYLYYDPGIPAVRQLIVDGVQEIVDNYNVDGIHFDDYFYPNSNSVSFNDDATYAAYSNGYTNKSDWRRNNIDTLVKSVSDVVRSAKGDVTFGISPAAVWGNSATLNGGVDVPSSNSTYLYQYADTKKWVTSGWLDYVTPQIYWQIGHKTADYATIAQWWADLCASSGTKLYIGHAAYKLGDSSMGDAWLNENVLTDQINFNISCGGISGDIYYGYAALANNTLGYKEKLHSLYYSNTVTDYAEPLQPEQTEETEKAEETASGVTPTGLLPNADVIGKSGDLITFSCYAPAGAEKVYVRVGPYQVDLKKDTTLAGSATGADMVVWNGDLALPQVNVSKDVLVIGKPNFVTKYEGAYATAISPYNVKVVNGNEQLRMATVTYNEAVTRLGPSTSFDRGTPLAQGAADVIVGQEGEFYKLKSGIYIYTGNVNVSSENSSKANSNSVSAVSFQPRDKYVDVIFDFSSYTPVYTVNWSGNTLTLNLYNLQGRQAPSVPQNTAFSDVTFTQVSDQLATYTFTLKKSYYGFDVQNSGGRMVFSVKAPPLLGSAELPLQYVTVYLDAGHGGSDAGAMALVSGQPNEETVNLMNMLQAKAYLESMGATVITTRTTDTTVDLTTRQDMIRTSGADISISIHANSVARTGNYTAANGLEVLYTRPQSEGAASVFQRALISALGSTDRGYKTQDLAVCRVDECPAILIETGFMTNPNEYLMISSADGQARIGQAVANATLMWVQAQN